MNHRITRPALVAASLLLGACAESIPDELTGKLDFSTGTPTFANYADDEAGWALTTETTVRLFGAAAVCQPGSNPCVPNDNARAWMEEVNATFVHGHSEGIALTTLAFQTGRLKPQDFGAATVAQLTLTPALQQEIAFWGATQKVPAALSADQSFTAKDVMPFLKQALAPDATEAWRLALAIRDERGFHAGHALVPFGFFKGKRDGEFIVRVYDSNWPGLEHRLTVDTQGNRWTYEGSDNPNAPRTYSGDEANGNRLYFTPVSAHAGPFEAPFAAGGHALVVAAEGARVMLADQGGAKVGIADDGSLSELGGAVRPAFAQSRCVLCPGPAEIVNYTLSPDGGMQGAQTISLSNFGNTAADGGTVNITAPGLTAAIDGVRTERSGALVTVSGQQVDYASSQSDTPMTLDVTVQNADGSTTTVNVKLDGSSDGHVVVDASDPANVKVTTTNTTMGTQTLSGSVTVTTTQPGGASTTVTTPVEVKPNTTTTATVEPATGSASVYPAPGTACDNARYDPRLLDGGTAGAETDVDCGGLCLGCASGKLCLVGRDCASGVCAGAGNGQRGVCQSPTCFDGVKNGSEREVDCGGSCFGTCPAGTQCQYDRDCAPSAYGSICTEVDSPGAPRCRARARRQLQVVGLGVGDQFNLDGTALDGVTRAPFTVTGLPDSTPATPQQDFTVTFDAYRYVLQNNGGSPAPGQSNYRCTLGNPTNLPSLVADGGWGDGGTPTLSCVRTGNSIEVTARGCPGMPVPFSTNVDGRITSQTVIGNGSVTDGPFTRNATVSMGRKTTYGPQPNGIDAQRQTCALSSQFFLPSSTQATQHASLSCDCEQGDFRGPTASGDPCSGVPFEDTIPNGTTRLVVTDLTTSSQNNFIFNNDAGCAGNPDPAQSGSDRILKRVALPANTDLYAQIVSGVSRYALNTVLAGSCGANGPTASTTGTTGLMCSAANDPGGTSVHHSNTTSATQSVYVVVDGYSKFDQEPLQVELTTYPAMSTAMGSPCSSGAVQAPGFNTTVNGQFFSTNNFLVPANTPSCAATGSPAQSGPDATYAFSVPSFTHFTVTLGSCNVIANLVTRTGCGTNDATSTTTGTHGVSCVASYWPRYNFGTCATQTLSWDNTTQTAQLLYLVVEPRDPGARGNFSFSTRTTPVVITPVATASGTAHTGNACTFAYEMGQNGTGLQEWAKSNDFYPLTAPGCLATPASERPSGSDLSLHYTVPPDNSLRMSVKAIDYNGDQPFYAHVMVGQTACGTNGTDFLDAGSVGATCAASTGPLFSNASSSGQVSYANTTASTQDVYVVLEGQGITPYGLRFTVSSTVSATDGGVADAGQPDAGAPDAGPPDAGPPDAGPPDAGPPDAGPPDAGPPDAGSGTCSSDSQCGASGNCWCASSPGNCAGAGVCVPGRAVISAVTDGTTPSGTFTVPAGCTQVSLSAWGAGGGAVTAMFPLPDFQGGPGGNVSGLLSAAPGDVFTVWIGAGGQPTAGIVGGEGVGSNLGVQVNGGFPEVGANAGGGGGLTSVRQTGSTTRSFTVPAGSGAGANQPGVPAGGMNAGTATPNLAGGDADPGTEGGGGGAGEPGGNGATAFQGPGDPGAFGTLPGGLTSAIGQFSGDPANNGTPDYLLCPSGTGTGQSGNGCVVLRCTTP